MVIDIFLTGRDFSDLRNFYPQGPKNTLLGCLLHFIFLFLLTFNFSKNLELNFLYEVNQGFFFNFTILIQIFDSSIY